MSGGANTFCRVGQGNRKVLVPKPGLGNEINEKPPRGRGGQEDILYAFAAKRYFGRRSMMRLSATEQPWPLA
jgi:hypothetical protein